jgi:hypothetical protein
MVRGPAAAAGEDEPATRSQSAEPCPCKSVRTASPLDFALPLAASFIEKH